MSAEAMRVMLYCRGASRSLPLSDCLDAAIREDAAVNANRWVKRLRLARVDGATFRDRFHYRGDSLWWFTEIYLHKESRVASWFETLYALERCVEMHAPDRVTVESASPVDRVIAASVLSHRGLADAAAIGGQSIDGVRKRLKLEARSDFFHWSARVSRWRRRSALEPLCRGGVVAFVHSAFWRRSQTKPVTSGFASVGSAGGGDGEEGYIGPVLSALEKRLGRDALCLVGVGPRVNFRARQWWHGLMDAQHDAMLPFAPVEAFADSSAIEPSRAVWHERDRNESRLLASRDLRAAAMLGEYDIWPVVSNELSGVVRLQWPWSARAMDEAGAVLDALAPAVALTYAEAGGWGRAIMLEARRRGISGVGLQHGFIYRHWLNYLHEPDEMQPSTTVSSDAGFPRPATTLLFDKYAEQHLIESGHFPRDTLAMTGSPRLDALASSTGAIDAARQQAIRESVGAAANQAVVIVAAKYAQIRRVFRQLVEAAARLPRLHLVVKCHPAETADPYQRDAAGFNNVTIATDAADLAGLLSIASAIVTVNSTVALDALVLGIPSLVVDLPNNLTPFVDEGVMLGADSTVEIAAKLEAVSLDGAERTALLARREAFLARYAMQADGRAADRASDAVASLVPDAVLAERASLGRSSG